MARDTQAFPTEDQLRALPPEPHLMVVQLAPIWEAFFPADIDDAACNQVTDEEYDVWMQWSGLAKTLLESWTQQKPCQFADVGHNRTANVKAILPMWRTMINSAKQKRIFALSQESSDSYAQQFEAILGTGFCYAFEDEPLANIRKKVDELEKLVNSAELDAWLKKRLLRRLAQLKKDLQARMSSLDVFFGTWAEINLLLKGTDDATKNIQETAKTLMKYVFVSALVIVGGNSPVPLLPADRQLEGDTVESSVDIFVEGQVSQLLAAATTVQASADKQ